MTLLGQDACRVSDDKGGCLRPASQCGILCAILGITGRRPAVGLLAFCFAAPSARAQAPAPDSLTAFVDVAVIPLDTERVLPHQTVVVRGARIVALGPASTTPVPANAVRIDGNGKYLLPGLADMHVHVTALQGERELFDYVAEGVTTVRNMSHGTFLDAGTYTAGLFDTLLHLRARAAAGEIWSPRIYLAGRWYTDPTRSIAQNVAAYHAAGFDFIKLHDEDGCIGMPECPDPELLYSREAGAVGADSVSIVAGLDSLVAAAQRVGLPVVGHPVVSLAYALAHHFASIEHAYYYLSLSYSAHHVHLQDQVALADTLGIPAAVAAFQQAGSWACPTLVLSQLEPNATASDTIYHTLQLKAVKALHDAGVGLLSGTDEPADMGGRTVHQELQALVEAGLSPYEALLASTRNVATFFKTQDSVGTVAPGKRADLLLLDDNPLADIRHTLAIAGVMVSGRWLSRAAIAERDGAYKKTSP